MRTSVPTFKPSRLGRLVVKASYSPYTPPPRFPGVPASTPYTSLPSTSTPVASPSGTYSASASRPEAFGTLEQTILENARKLSDGWKEIEGAYVLFPKKREPKAVVHFIGGSFVGAAPQLTYGLFLEALAAHGCVVVATGYATSFDHLRVSDECNFKFDRAMRTLGNYVYNLPVYGVGHSLGSLAHLLICARYPSVPRAGNVLLSYNNRPATDSIPLLAPVVSPSAALVAPLIRQIAQSPVRAPVEALAAQLRALSPGAVRQVLPLLEQLTVMYSDFAAGRQEFIPAPEESRRLVRSYYQVPRNLLVKFRGDSIDESADLASMLSNSSAISDEIDLTLKVLWGDHSRPLSQTPVEVPPIVVSAGSQGAELIGRLAQIAAEAGVPTQVTNEVEKMSANVALSLNGTARGSSAGRSPWAGNLEEIADEISHFMGINDGYELLANYPRTAPGQVLANGAGGFSPNVRNF